MRVFLTLLLTAVGFWAVEFSLFHTGEYYKILRHDSSTGYVESYVHNELNRVRRSQKQVIAVGDSRMGFLARSANQLRDQTGYEFASIALGGATPRDWYYMLRGVDPNADKYNAVVIPLEDYEDAETYEDLMDRVEDVSYVIGRLQYSDIPEFPRSYRTVGLQWAAARAIVFKGLIYKRDLQDFFLHPTERLEMVKLAHKDSPLWYYNYVGPNKTMDGVSVDWQKRTITVPTGFTEEQREIFWTRFLYPRPMDRGVHAAYLRKWLGKIYEHYRGSKTKLVFLRLPRGPFVRPDQPELNPHSFARQLAAEDKAVLMPEHLFDSLEQPAMFIDDMHLNGPGSIEFSRILAKEVSRKLDAF